MIEDLAEFSGQAVSRETLQQLEHYARLLRDESARQNLVSASTLENLWERHILDSAQLARYEPRDGASWLDIGSGAGLPGVVIALVVSGPVLLVEPRRLRAEFLSRVIDELGLESRVTVAASKVENVTGSFDTITARAVASLDRLLTAAFPLSTKNTLWVLPKGRAAQSELAEARRSWQCDAEAVPSRTDAESEILLLRNVRARGKR